MRGNKVTLWFIHVAQHQPHCTYGCNFFGKVLRTMPHVQTVMNSKGLVFAFIWVYKEVNYVILLQYLYYCYRHVFTQCVRLILTHNGTNLNMSICADLH